jgi:hypothetical protein
MHRNYIRGDWWLYWVAFPRVREDRDALRPGLWLEALRQGVLTARSLAERWRCWLLVSLCCLLRVGGLPQLINAPAYTHKEKKPSLNIRSNDLAGLPAIVV